MTAKRRTSGPMTCPARPRCSDSRSEERTGFRSGLDVNAYRVSVRSRRRPPAIFWQPVDGGDAEPSHEARTWRITCSGVVVSEGRPASVQRHEGLRRVVMDVLDRGERRRRRSARFTRRIPPARCFRRMDDGWRTRVRNGARRRSTSSHSHLQETRISFPRKGPTVPHAVVWSPDGKELFYIPRSGGFEAVSVTTEPRFGFGSPVAVPRPPQVFLGPPNSRTLYDITPRGEFVVLVAAGRTSTARGSQIQVILNWFEELKARVPTK